MGGVLIIGEKLYFYLVLPFLSRHFFCLQGGTKVLIVGGWYLRGHDYTVMFGDRQVPATLFHAGVLRCFAPRTHLSSFYIKK